MAMPKGHKVVRTPAEKQKWIKNIRRARLKNLSTIKERFFSKVDQRTIDECWEWTGSRDEKGYGLIRVGGRHGNLEKAHRVSYRLCVGPIHRGKHVLHHCDNPCCVNPTHLRIGTHRDNMRDRNMRDRQTKGERHPHAVLTKKEVLEIREREQATNKELAEVFGVHNSVISRIRNRKSWKHV